MSDPRSIWHLKLFGRAACRPVASEQRPHHKLTIIRNDVTCEKCKLLVKQQWGELVAKHPERTEEQVIEAPIYTPRAVGKSVKPASPLAGGREVAPASDIGVQVPVARPKQQSEIEEDLSRINRARATLKMA